MSRERAARSKSNRKRRRRIRRGIFSLILVVFIAAAGFGVYRLIDRVFLPEQASATDDAQSRARRQNEPPAKQEKPVKSDPAEISIVCVGDVIVHSTQITAADRGGGNYDFSEYFPHAKPYIESADLAVCNLELTFGGTPYSGYPLFSTPDQLANVLKDTGFDVGVTANNHMLDRGPSGIGRTIDVAAGAGLLVTGSVKDATEKDYLITEVKGVKIGIVAYTYETSVSADNRTINGIGMSAETRSLINSFGWASLDADMQAVKQSMDGARADGAEILICVFHWGNEYERQPNGHQRKAAEMLVGFGADIIFASHPHVLQPFETLTDPETGKRVPVFWSMGNFISNQRRETLDTSMGKYTEQGMIARVDLTYDPDSRSITRGRMSCTPTWVDKYSNG
ncbi:MAG: CapA family protein, partial [Clostridiales Family XIII bacterium]|nr:CapA family protein [Clostridiales Family XIII bacterium]